MQGWRARLLFSESGFGGTALGVALLYPNPIAWVLGLENFWLATPQDDTDGHHLTCSKSSVFLITNFNEMFKHTCGRNICDLFLSNFEGILLPTDGTNCPGVKMMAVEEIEAHLLWIFERSQFDRRNLTEKSNREEDENFLSISKEVHRLGPVYPRRSTLQYRAGKNDQE